MSSNHHEGEASQPTSLFVSALSHLAYYLGHDCDIFTTEGGSAKILEAFVKRLDRTKWPSWRKLSALASQRLTTALIGQEFPQTRSDDVAEEWFTEFFSYLDDIPEYPNDTHTSTGTLLFGTSNLKSPGANWLKKWEMLPVKLVNRMDNSVFTANFH